MMFGLFTLSGIVVNDSIILVVFYKQLRERAAWGEGSHRRGPRANVCVRCC